MTQKELLEKLYNKEITEDDVIVKKEINDEEYPMYICNDGYEFWDDNGIISLDFIFKKNNYFYEIISVEEFKKRIEEKERQEKIKKLEKELKKLKNQI